MSKTIPKNPIKFGLYSTKPHRGWALGALTAVFIGTALTRFLVVVLQKLTDSIANPTQNINQIWVFVIAFPLLYLLAETVWRMSGFTGMRWFTSLGATAYQTLYEYLSLHSKEYFNSRFAGALVNKIANAVDGSQMLFQKILWRFIPLGLTLFWYMIFAGANDWRLGFIIIIWSVFFLGVNIFLVNKLQPYSYEFAQSISTLKGRLVDSLANISLVHEYSYIAGERGYIKNFVENQRRAGLDIWWRSEWILVTNGLLIGIFMLVMIGTSIYFYQNNIVTIGAVVMIIAIVNDLSNSLFFIGIEIADISKFYGKAREGLDDILRKHAIIDSSDAKLYKFSEGNISVESIDFEYANAKVFNKFSLNIPSGQKVGLVGRSGAGKTTLVSLLLRHFDVQDGAIKLDNQDIRQITLASLRRAIAFVPQDTSLFHRTIKENIRYSNPQASDPQVIKAAKQAQAHEFILRLKNGYDTKVGERGVKLSGGQRQRITIARAFLKNAPILILDEATSSLDSESEQAIQKSLVSLMKGRTVIAIAHRLSTLKRMDRLVIIEDGKIVEDASPTQLLQKPDGIFKKMWENQVNGFIVDDAN